MKIGILGAGGIAVQMAKTVAGMKDVENYAVAARSFERAQAFAEKYGFSKAYGSYEEMLADPQVDLVYIANPSFPSLSSCKDVPGGRKKCAL